MKNKILTFIIGLLVGAIITTFVFFIYLKVNKNENASANNQTQQMGMPGEMGEPPAKPDGETESTDGNTTEKRTRPTKTDGENTSYDSSRPTPPDMQNGDNQKPSEESQDTNNNA